MIRDYLEKVPGPREKTREKIIAFMKENPIPNKESRFDIQRNTKLKEGRA
ncbi:MAG: hypothetical protein ACQESF_07200 [Nanobdellota archaeon]